jgi:hypothetical protein
VEHLFRGTERGELDGVQGGVPIAQYVYDMVDCDGFRFPAKRRAYVRGPGAKAIRDLLLISIDLSDYRVE